METPAPQIPLDERWLTPKQVQEAKIQIVAASTREVHDLVMAGGKVTFDDLRVAHVFSPVNGRVTQVLAQLGQHVVKGEPLVDIASPDVSTAFADLLKAQADLTAAEHEFNRQKELYEAHAAAKKDYETAEDNYRKAKAEVDRARLKVRLFRSGTVDEVTHEYQLRSPIDGDVVTRGVSPGMEVQGQYAGGAAVELYTIGDLDQVWVIADVFEMDVARVSKDAEVSLKMLAYPDKTFVGRVDWVSDTLDPASRTARVRCKVPNPGHLLKPEMYATVSINSGARTVTTVPRNAPLRLGEQRAVFVRVGEAPDGRVKFRKRPVVVDEDVSGDFLPVRQGLEPGEQVVASGAILLAGMP
jgi:cobalt-zinc-cadmium efflux system membrane fusion protein